MTRSFLSLPKIILVAVVLVSAMLMCARALSLDSGPFRGPAADQTSTAASSEAAAPEYLSATPNPAVPLGSPTPDPPRQLPALRLASEQYVVQAGDTLNAIAQRYTVSVDDIVQANDLADANLVSVGQTLTIPPPKPQGTGPAFKVIPDSELVYGPASVGFDVAAFIAGKGGYLARYTENMDGQETTGAQVITRVAQDYSVNPRLLLAALEYQSGWVTQANPPETSLDYPMGVVVSARKGLYHQLTWAANILNMGFYLWRVNGLAAWVLTDRTVLLIDPTINAGTAGVQYFFSELYGRAGWEQAVSQQGFYATYRTLFGDPFALAVEPLLPPDLAQPTMQLPFEPGLTWAFTGGPHGGWDSGSAWAALDFAPPSQALGCVQSDAWVAAVADGLILRAGNGAVIEDLDGDGQEQTGWVVLYMHIETRDRIAANTPVHAGDRIGHPSCEGGVSTGTHVHLARRYNGEWVPADQSLPFVLDGWTSYGEGNEYDGYLKKGDQVVEALEGRFPQNAISR
jgi:LasA protease